jgi:8-oxo-dGTP pyrophosphatase MutT (NUDIX family)
MTSRPLVPPAQTYLDLLALNPPRGQNERGETEVLTRAEEVAAAEAAYVARHAEDAGTDACAGIAFRDHHLTVIRDAIRRPDGSLDLKSRIVYTGAEGPVAGIVMLPLIGDHVAFVRQWRHPLQGWTLEAPRGRLLGPDEGAVPAVVRELGEELGAKVVGDLFSLGRLAPESGAIGANVLVYLAQVEFVAEPQPEAFSEIFGAPKILAPADIAAHIAGGKIEDALTLAALTRAVIRKKITPAIFGLGEGL